MGAVSAPIGPGREKFIFPIGAVSAPGERGFDFLYHGFGKRFLTFVFEPRTGRYGVQCPIFLNLQKKR